MSERGAAAPMAPARRVLLAPPEAWDEPRLLAAARAFPADAAPLRAGDELGGLVVLGVEPGPGAPLGKDTEVVIRAQPRANGAPRVDVAILLDTGASMAAPWDRAHDRLGAARACIQTFLASPGAGVEHVSLFEYAKECRRLAGPTRPAGIAPVDPSRPRGASRTGPAIDAALAQLAAEASPDRAQAILLLTDGIGDFDALLAAATRAGRLRVPIHALVFAPEVDVAFEALARESRGSVQKATHPLTIEFEHAPGGRP